MFSNGEPSISKCLPAWVLHCICWESSGARGSVLVFFQPQGMGVISYVLLAAKKQRVQSRPDCNWRKRGFLQGKECLGREICYMKPPHCPGITFLCAGEIRSCVLWRCFGFGFDALLRIKILGLTSVNRGVIYKQAPNSLPSPLTRRRVSYSHTMKPEMEGSASYWRCAGCAALGSWCEPSMGGFVFSKQKCISWNLYVELGKG